VSSCHWTTVEDGGGEVWQRGERRNVAVGASPHRWAAVASGRDRTNLRVEVVGGRLWPSLKHLGPCLCFGN
jgi:hypothetical protein